jgi:hypothetical protein
MPHHVIRIRRRVQAILDHEIVMRHHVDAIVHPVDAIPPHEIVKSSSRIP